MKVWGLGFRMELPPLGSGSSVSGFRGRLRLRLHQPQTFGTMGSQRSKTLVAGVGLK